MDDDLEQLLRTLTPVKPSAALDARIDALLRGEDAVRDGVLARLRPWLLAGASLAAAACLALLAQIPAPGIAPEPAPVLAYETAWSSLTPQGVVFVDDQTPAYAYTQDTVQQVTYRDPRDDSEIVWAWPTEQTWVLPIAYQ